MDSLGCFVFKINTNEYLSSPEAMAQAYVEGAPTAGPDGCPAGENSMPWHKLADPTRFELMTSAFGGPPPSLGIMLILLPFSV